MLTVHHITSTQYSERGFIRICMKNTRKMFGNQHPILKVHSQWAAIDYLTPGYDNRYKWSAFSITFWVGGYWPRIEGGAFSCLLEMTFKESHIVVPHSNNISQLGTGPSKVLWVAGCRLWSKKSHMWCAHEGEAFAEETRGGPPSLWTKC
jgi:hypothetical protein